MRTCWNCWRRSAAPRTRSRRLDRPRLGQPRGVEHGLPPSRHDGGRGSLCVPYLASGFTLENVVSLVDRKVYPEAEFPAGQWDYQFFYEESFDKACKGFNANIRNVVKALFRKGDPKAVGKPSRTASVRRSGGWFGGAPSPTCHAIRTSSPRQDMEAYTAALTRNGFFGPNFLVHEPQGRRCLRQACAKTAASFRCRCCSCTAPTTRPARRCLAARQVDAADCTDLTEVVVNSGHWMAQEKPVVVNAALAKWLARSCRNTGRPDDA